MFHRVPRGTAAAQVVALHMRSTTLLASLVLTAVAGCATDSTDNQQTWSFHVDYVLPRGMPCAKPPGDMFLDVTRDAYGHYTPAEHEYDEVAIWQEEDPAHHAIDLEVGIRDRDPVSGIEYEWLFIGDWSGADPTIQVAYTGSASMAGLVADTDQWQCQTQYAFYGYAL
jgi:hypothetical protein